jgi:hypothetical protein
VTKGKSSGQRRFPEQGLDNACAQRIRHGNHLISGMQGPCSDQHCNLAAGVGTFAASLEIVVSRDAKRFAIANSGVDRAMLAGRFFDPFKLLQIVRNDDSGDGALRHRNAPRAVDQMAKLRGHHRHLDKLARHVLE